MKNLKRPPQEIYTEAEAADALEISIERLHQLLDKHLFSAQDRRPESIEFTATDLLLLSYWNSVSKKSPPNQKVLQMPRRK
jgi:hypothetical protein